METLDIILKISISLGLLNAWIFRVNKQTPFRGGSANNMAEEFKAYGLPVWSMYTVGGLKIFLALLLIISVFRPILEAAALIGIMILMLGAIIMHIKIKDPIIKSVPALTLLVLSIVSYLI